MGVSDYSYSEQSDQKQYQQPFDPVILELVHSKNLWPTLRQSLAAEHKRDQVIGREIFPRVEYGISYQMVIYITSWILFFEKYWLKNYIVRMKFKLKRKP